MSKAWKIVLIVLLIIVVLAVIAFFWAKSIWDKISFGKPRIRGLDLQGLSLADLVNIAFAGASKTITANIELDIKNDSGTSIPFRIYKIRLVSNGTVISETSEQIVQKKFSLPARGSVTIADTITFNINDVVGNILIEKAKGNSVQLEYQIVFSLFGIPVPYHGDTFTW